LLSHDITPVITFVRVDNRLIHGQVVEAWLPHLRVKRVVVADDEAASSPLVRAAMGLAVPSGIDVLIQARDEVPYEQLVQDEVKTLLLFRDVDDVVRARSKGLTLTRLNLGNVHFSAGRTKISSSVFLTRQELDEVRGLAGEGVDVEARPVPSETPLPLEELVSRFEKGK
jgi:mannose/fructose/N-acetylgalactosamine-specific phosphotransferase system component IIB